MENTLESPQNSAEKYKKLIIAVSIIVPLAVAALFGIKIDGYDLSFLPPIYAGINAGTAILLVAAVIAIKNRRRELHETLMKICIGLSVCFLVMYVAYHITSETTHYGGTGGIRYVYFFLLISHIILSVAIIPLVLFTFVRAWSGNFAKHRALAKFTFPLWLYVAVTGVVVYWMLSPYYR
jgi:putative membrane protein